MTVHPTNKFGKFNSETVMALSMGIIYIPEQIRNEFKEQKPIFR